jgi:hypothetical protein
MLAHSVNNQRGTALMTATYNPAAEEAFFAHISDAPQTLKAFFNQLAFHFRERNDTSVAYTFSNNRKGQMRIWAFWTKRNGKQAGRVVATLHWQPRKYTIACRSLLTPEDLRRRSFPEVKAPHSAEVLNCDWAIGEDDWTHRATEVIQALDASVDEASVS